MTSTFEGQPPTQNKTCFQSKQGSSKGSRSTYSFVHKYQQLVGGFNPSEKILVKMGLFPNFRGENEQNETTTQGKYICTTKNAIFSHHIFL